MTELMKKAIAKIDAEGEKGGTNQKRIAQYIIDALITDDISAGKVTDEKKSLADCVKAVTGKQESMPRTAARWSKMKRSTLGSANITESPKSRRPTTLSALTLRICCEVATWDKKRRKSPKNSIGTQKNGFCKVD